jgi:predicted nucleic acid-binding protein
MVLIYLDHNCFQRGFDDPRQIKIQLEALACEEIFSRAGKKIHLVWSFIHEDESMLCPFIERKLAVNSMKKLCQIHVEPVDEILEMARSYVMTAHLSPKDALHVACAMHCGARYFLTCDTQLIKRALRLKLNMIVSNPVDYIREV